MMGKYSLLINQATVVAALQHYFEAVVFKTAPKVLSVKQDPPEGYQVNVNPNFTVEVESAE